MPGRTWTIRLTGHHDHSARVSCTTAGCRMPERSKDVRALRAFAADHVRAHARLATPRPNAACACGGAGCRHHQARALCSGRTLLVLIHNPAVAEVWTLAEICEACAPLITHARIVARAASPAEPRGPERVPEPRTAPGPSPPSRRPLTQTPDRGHDDQAAEPGTPFAYHSASSLRLRSSLLGRGAGKGRR
ncbi:hypothetical protein Shyd_84010 [Streptomyces hydrogenans]|uniref:Post-SET domain-containing protein n=1 Tax=Streptomyces hydrogenans TaxID=1873719 RepID=A0ABQ3PPS6_9ACTN|nr:hypothetical protein [Streptomyces hydrogenans]GHI27030.1 hypothetical protein Shyd_84010 [Streptomyces hydrogenans]